MVILKISIKQINIQLILYIILIVEMARKNSQSEQDEDFQDEEEVPIEEQVEQKIKGLSSLAEKIQAIAINGFLIEKRALDKKLQGEHNAIEVKYRKTYEPYLEQIYKIASGLIDLVDEDLEGVDHLLTQQQKEVKKNYYPKKPIQEYWLKSFISSDSIAESVQPDDEGALKHLIRVEATKTEDGNNLTVTFHFSENEWFTNQSIKKQFELEGDQIKRSYGDQITWKQGKNLTVQIVKKKNKKKKTTVTKQVEKQSFFNIFKQIDLTGDDQEQKQDQKDKNEDEEELGQVEKLQRQYQICNAIYEQVLPRSLEYYLGVVGAMDFEDLAELGGLEGAEDEDEVEEDADKNKKKNSKPKKRKGSHSSKQ